MDTPHPPPFRRDAVRRFDADASFASLSARLGRGAAGRPVSSVAPRRPLRAAARQDEGLVDVHFDGVDLIVTTETEAGAVANVDDMRLILRFGAGRERLVALPCRVKPASLRVQVVNGILEATMTPEDSGG